MYRDYVCNWFSSKHLWLVPILGDTLIQHWLIDKKVRKSSSPGWSFNKDIWSHWADFQLGWGICVTHERALMYDLKERHLFSAWISSHSQDSWKSFLNKVSPRRSEAGWNPTECKTIFSACGSDPGGRIAHAVLFEDSLLVWLPMTKMRIKARWAWFIECYQRSK